MQNHVLQKDNCKYAIIVANKSFRQNAPYKNSTSTTKTTTTSDDKYLYVQSKDTHGSKIPTMSVMINEIPVDMIINTDVSIDILDETAPSCITAEDRENSSGETDYNSGSVATCEQI